MAPKLTTLTFGTPTSFPFTTTDSSEDLCTSYSTMTDTVLNVTCEGAVDCTKLDKQPGASIVFPTVLSLTGITGQFCSKVTNESQ